MYIKERLVRALKYFMFIYCSLICVMILLWICVLCINLG